MGRDALNSKQEMLKDEDLVCLARTNIFFFWTNEIHTKPMGKKIKHQSLHTEPCVNESVVRALGTTE